MQVQGNWAGGSQDSAEIIDTVSCPLSQSDALQHLDKAQLQQGQQ